MVAHPRTASSSRTAEAAHVPGGRLAKSVVVHHEMGYVLAVVPSTHRVELGTLQAVLDKRLGLASESEVCK
ncbi:YbaK/EbsC family protein, partial [Serratia marcescens]|uniref:YbaK/EbsC family protein n=1 Tax=Serratia marcescens TaxID=615 RepID=UPI001952A221